MNIQIDINPDDIARVNLFLNDVEAGVVMRRAINETLDGVRTDATRVVYADLNLTQRRIRENFFIRRATGTELAASFASRGRPVNLASFIGTRTTTRGLSVKVKRAGTRTTLRHAFTWNRTTASGDAASTAFQRAWTGPRTSASNQMPWKAMTPRYRLPLETLTGPRIEDILSRLDVITNLEQSAGARLEKNVSDQLEYIMSRHR